MYLATSGGVFYRFLMSQLPAQSGAATGPAIVIRTGNPSLQLSFSCDSSVLWAQNYENNQWSTVDVGASASEGERERERRERKTAAAAKFKRVGEKLTLDLHLFFRLFHINSHGRCQYPLHPVYPRAIQGPARPRGGGLLLCLIFKPFFYFFYFFPPWRATR